MAVGDQGFDHQWGRKVYKNRNSYHLVSSGSSQYCAEHSASIVPINSRGSLAR